MKCINSLTYLNWAVKMLRINSITGKTTFIALSETYIERSKVISFNESQKVVPGHRLRLFCKFILR